MKNLLTIILSASLLFHEKSLCQNQEFSCTSTLQSNITILDQELAPDGTIFSIGRFRNITYSDHIYLTKSDSSGTLLWEKIILDTGYDNLAYSLAVDDKSIYCCGTNTRWPAFGDNNSFIIRLSLQGDFLWERQIDTLGVLYDIIAYKDGGCVASGYGIPQPQVYGGLLVRLDSSGNIVWTTLNRWNLAINHSYNDVVSDSSGNIFVCGTADGNYATLTKIDSNGTCLWSKSYQDFSTTLVFTSCIVKGNTIWVLGRSQLPSQSGGKIIVAKMDLSGNCIEVKATGDSLQSYIPYSFCVTASNSVVVVGYGGWSSNHHSFMIEFDNNLNFVRGIQNNSWHVLTDVLVQRDTSFAICGWSANNNPYQYHRGYMTNAWNIGCGFVTLLDSSISKVIIQNTMTYTTTTLSLISSSSLVAPISCAVTTCYNLTSLAEPNTLSRLQIFPNPASELFTIEFQDEIVRQSFIFLTDVEGRVVKRQQLDIGTTVAQIITGDLAGGLYFVRIDDLIIGKIVLVR